MAQASSYQTVRHIGTGTDAEVYLVRRVSDGEQFAMKVAHPTHHAARAIHMEYKLLSDLDHPNLLDVEELVQSGGREAIILEYFPGADLRRMMREDPRRVVRHLGYIIEQCGDAVCYLHEHGIVHGDVKPENILVAGGGRVRLIDFNIAIGGIWGWLRPGKLEGTPKYMAPEHIREKRPGPKSDLYSLGVVCYEVIAGDPPFDGATSEEILEKQLKARPRPLRQFRRGMSSRVEGLVMQALEKDPRARPPDCRTFGRCLSRMLRSPLEAPELLGMA